MLPMTVPPLPVLSDRPMMKPYRPVPRDWSIIRKIGSGSLMTSAYGLLTRDC